MSKNLQILYFILLFFSWINSSNTIESIDLNLFGVNEKKVQSAYKGDPSAQMSLAEFYCAEKECKCEKCEKAVFWYKKLVENESFEVQNKILEKYLAGDDFLTKDVIYKLIDKYQKWAKAGDIQAQKLLIDLFSQRSISNDYIKFLYKKRQGDPYLMFDEILREHSLKIGKDNREIIQLFNKLALQNKNIGFKCVLWNNRISKEKEKKCRKSRFEKALLNNCPLAQFLYGVLLLNDFDDSKCYKEYYKLAIFPSDEKEKKKKTIEIFEKLSHNKWYSIADWFFIGESFSYKFNKKQKKIEKYDFKLGVKWYTKAYEIGNDPKTAYEIGLLYKEGDKTLIKNYSKAFEWFYKSAVQNYMPAQIEIGYMYSHGLGVQENQKSAVKWLKKAYNHNSFVCRVCYKTQIMLNNLGFINFFRNIKQIYEF